MKKAIILSFALVLLVSGCTKTEQKEMKTMQPEEIKQKTEKFISGELAKSGMTNATVEAQEVTEEKGLYKVVVKMQSADVSQERDFYVTKDGARIFTDSFLMDPAETSAETPAVEKPKTPAPKVGKQQDKPNIELFVMSHCPFGTQIEKGILPVLDLLGDKVEFELKFCDYAMHGEVEVKEQLTQYCIQKEQVERFNDYLKCFLGDGNSTGCIAKTNVDTEKLKKCTWNTDIELGIMEDFNNKSTWTGSGCPDGGSCFASFNINKEDSVKYNVKGSPALVVNGVVVNTGRRDSQGLLETICSSFSKEPEECAKTLSSDNPSSGFGYNEGSTGSAGSCE